jgi:hypothetical protein
MNRGVRRSVLVAGLLALAGMGCSPANLAWLIFQNNDKVPPEHPLPPKEGKKGVTVALIGSASPTLGIEFAGIDRELVTLVGQRMAEETKDSKHPITVIDQSKVDKIKSGATDWRARNMADVAKQLGADYLIDLSVITISMFQPEYGREFYQGRANVQVTVYDAAKADGAYRDYTHNSMLPTKGTEGVTAAAYRKMFVGRLATEIAWRHIPHAADPELKMRP